MGGQSNMGGATQATQGTGMQPFDLSKLFMGNAPASQATGGMQLPQIQAPARPPMPTLPVRTPMPQPQVAQPQGGNDRANFMNGLRNYLEMNGVERHLNRRDQGR